MSDGINRIVRSGYLLAELVSLAVAFVVAHMLRGVSFDSTQHDKIFLYFGAVFWVALSSLFKCRRVIFSPVDRLLSLARTVALFALSISMVAFFFKEADYSRLVVVYFVITHAVLVFLVHSFGDLYVIHVHRSKRMLKNTCLLGDEERLTRIQQELLDHPEYGYAPCCSIPFDQLNDPEQLKCGLQEKEINEVIVRCSYNEFDKLNQLVEICEPLGIRITIIPIFGGVIHSTLAPVQFLSRSALRVRELPMDDVQNKVSKRVFDLVFATLVLLVLSPLFLVLGLLIKCSSKGPAFFRQERTGYNQKQFFCLKFRSMRVTDKSVSDKVQATENDPRKTSIGEFLRRTNLDELPQFINVLKGEMSVVGPRPHMLAHTEEFSEVADGYLTRHFVKPGITGWAQVNGWRGPTDTEEKIRGRVEHDLWYVENWSLWLDVKIVLMTVFGSKSKENAF